MYSKKLKVVTSYPDNPCSSYQEWVETVLKGNGKMRTSEYLSMIEKDRGY